MCVIVTVMASENIPSTPKSDPKLKSQRSIIERRVFVAAGLITCILLIGGLVVLRNGQSDEQPKSGVTTYQSRGPSKGDYEVLAETPSKESLRVAVIIKKLSDDKLISINDKLLSEYQPKAKNLFIDYFDDSEVAKVYFAKINDPQTSPAQKRELARHYKALMVSSGAQGKKLYAVDSSGRVIKSY